MADAHAKPHHDYHLVDPSPWPAVGSISAFVMAVGAITWMHHMFAAAPLVFGAGVIGVLYTMLSWWRDVIKEARARGLSHPRGADFPPLRHDPVHRLRGDVLRRLVLGLFRRRAVSRRRASGGAQRADRRRLAAEAGGGRLVPRHLRSVASAAAQHADPADLGHHGDLGASRAAARRPQGPDQRPVADHHPRRAPSPACRPTNTPTRPSPIPATSTARPSSWRPASTAPTC